MEQIMNSSHINWNNIYFSSWGIKIWIRRNQTLSTVEQIGNTDVLIGTTF
jgi:hypothetical protein